MDFQPSAGQAAAVELFDRFAVDPDRTIFALLGYAGTGKTTTYGRMAAKMKGQVITAAPTHKAINVVRRNLTIPYEIGYSGPSGHVHGRLITGTTAQLIGLRPVIAEEQDENTREFAGSDGILRKLNDVKWVVIDEVSMLSQAHLDMIEMRCMEIGAKLLIIGDPGQLPPVNAEPIDWASIPDVAELSQVMRTAEDSAIPLLAQEVRMGRDWTIVRGAGVTHTDKPGKAFLDSVEEPAEREQDRDVFIAYTNRVVDEVQELACREVYGHGRRTFLPDQLVISESRFETEVMTYVEKYGRSYPRMQVVANNADELVVQEFGDRGRWGTEVRLRKAGESRSSFTAEYLTEEEIIDKKHPYNVAVREAFGKANELQAAWKKDKGNWRLDDQRKDAWSAAFDLKDRTVISFRHPFALTSHKSQGSTYRRVFVDAGDIERFPETGKQSLYVAATRPSEELVIG